MNDLGMVIFNHTRSLMSSPELGEHSILAILYIGVVMVSLTASPVNGGTTVWQYVCTGIWECDY